MPTLPPVLIAMLAAFLPLLPAFFPVLGLAPLYRLRGLRATLLIVAWGWTITTWVHGQGSYVVLLFVTLFSVLAGVLEPQRIFVALDNPKHIPVSLVNLRNEALVLGHEEEGLAVAWPFAMLIPRHVVNDRLGDTPALVAY